MAAGPGGCYAPGVHAVPDDLAIAWIRGGFAAALEADEKPAAPSIPAPVVETATAPARGERAESGVRRGRRRG